MLPGQRLIVFNALVVRALVINDDGLYTEELDAFRLAFTGRRFKILVTQEIILEYQSSSDEGFALQLQPTLEQHFRRGRAVYKPDNELNNPGSDLSEFPKEHRTFWSDTVRGGATYLVTRRKRWLDLANHARSEYGLQIVTPPQFIELES